MKNLDLLPIAEEKKKRLKTFARMYRQNARISIEVVSFRENRLVVRVEQKEVMHDHFWSKKELIERTREMFQGEVPEDWKVVVSPVDYDPQDIESVSAHWIVRRMNHLGIKAKHICKSTGIDKSTISSLINGEKELTKWHKTAFYYFFKYQEVAQF
jgi:hypothetical protein